MPILFRALSPTWVLTVDHPFDEAHTGPNADRTVHLIVGIRARNRGIEKPRDRECVLNRGRAGANRRRKCVSLHARCARGWGVYGRIGLLKPDTHRNKGGSKMVVTKFIYKGGSSVAKHNARARRSHAKLFGRINFPDSRYRHRLWPCAKTSLSYIIFYERVFLFLA